MRPFLYLIILTFLFNPRLQAQDFHFSQFEQLPLLRNPALAGVFDGDLRVSGAFRNQWQSVSAPFKTSALNAEIKFPVFAGNDWLTLGISAVHDVAGDVKLKRTQLMPVLNYHKSLSGDYDDYISLAFMAGPVNSQFDPTQLKLDDQFQNGSFSINNPTNQVFQRTGFTYWDASTGITYASGFGEDSRYYIGAAMYHFNKPKVAFYTSNSNVHIDPKYVLNAGLSTPTSDIHRFKIYADYYLQGGSSLFAAGAMYVIEVADQFYADKRATLSLGASYRWNDAIVPAVRLDWFDMSLGISYDINISRLAQASSWRGGFELTAAYQASFTNRSAARDGVRCVR